MKYYKIKESEIKKKTKINLAQSRCNNPCTNSSDCKNTTKLLPATVYSIKMMCLTYEMEQPLHLRTLLMVKTIIAERRKRNTL